MKAIHIIAGILSLIAGFTALYAAKGQWLHRKAGTVFSYAMLTMTGLGALLALTTNPNRPTAVIGLLCFYLVATGLLTVIRSVEQQRRVLLGLACLATALAVAAWLLGFMAAGSPGSELDHIPSGMIFMFASIATLAAIGDARVLWRGSIAGVQRLHRHLWRMGYAMWVATTSAFLGQAKHLPDWLREEKLHLVPVLLVTVTVVFWLVRVRWVAWKKQSRLASSSRTAAQAAPTAAPTLSGTAT